MRLGWAGIGWLQNPLPAAAAIFSGSAPTAVSGAALARRLRADRVTAAVACTNAGACSRI
jgi:hypothetical protein